MNIRNSYYQVSQKAHSPRRLSLTLDICRSYSINAHTKACTLFSVCDLLALALESAVIVSELIKKPKFIDSAVSTVTGVNLTVNGF